MCSIPGLPTPGSHLMVTISRVNVSPTCGLVELWVQKDDDRKQSYEQMKNEIQIPGEKFQNSEGKPEDLCLVLITDTWHRARIVSLQSEIYNVFLIDQGKPHIATSQELAWAHSDSFVLPPEVEYCILANVVDAKNDWPEKAAKFLQSLSQMKFTGQVQHVLMPDRITLLQIPVVSKHMCKLGVTKEILKEDFQCLALKWQHSTKGEPSQSHNLPQEQNLNGCDRFTEHDQYFYPQLSTGTYEVVELTEITDEINVFCKLYIFSKEVKMLSERIQQDYEADSHCNAELPKTSGVPCATKGTDGQWHRSILKQDICASDSAVKVLHVDDGKTEMVPTVDIKPLNGKFLRMPVFTYCCSFVGITGLSKKWTADKIDFLKSLLLNKKVVARFDQHNILPDSYDVVLYASSGSRINDCFMEKTGEHNTTQPKSETADASNHPFLSLFLGSLKDQQYMDLHTEIKSFPEEKKIELGETNDLLALDINTTKSSEGLNPMVDEDSLTEVQNACDDYGLPAGSQVAVNVSSIESSERFWCQKVNSRHLLETLSQALQTYYASDQSQSFVESFYVARNAEDNMWHRAQIIVNNQSPEIDVRFIDTGKTQKVHLQDVCPIDPAFLRIGPQAFQCCPFSATNTINPSVAFPDAASAEFQKFLYSVASSRKELNCSVKAVVTDEQGQQLHVVDIETKSEHMCKNLAEEFESSDGNVRDPPRSSLDYVFSSPNLEFGKKEKMWVTFCETANHFYCRLDRSSGLFESVMEDLGRHLGAPQFSDQPPGRNNICIAKYTDDKWYRGQVTELYPQIQVHFVDYGETRVVNKKDICHFPFQASLARSTPVLAVPLGLSNIPAELPEKINQWFADQTIGQEFTMTVVAIEKKGKFIVDLFDATTHVNEIIRQKVEQMKKNTLTDLQQPDEEPPSTVTELSIVQEEEFSPKTIETPKATQCSGDATQNNVTVYEPEQLSVDVVHKDQGIVAEPSWQLFHNGSKEQRLSPSSGSFLYNWPNDPLKDTEESFVSTNSGPQYFWCQDSNAELIPMSEATQVAGNTAQDATLEFLKVGFPCLALFSEDNQWYRAQVIEKSVESLRVLFVDYGNDSEVDIRNVKAIPQCLLDIPPRAFLCCLNGFESKGSFDDDVNDTFYNLLMDKPLKVTMVDVKEHLENRVPQYLVEIECEGAAVNTAMLKYWKPATGNDKTESLQKDNLPQCGQAGISAKHRGFPEEQFTTFRFKEPDVSKIVSKIQTDVVYASSIAEPHFFWCQFADVDGLVNVSELAQKAGEAPPVKLIPETLIAGSPCLALFPSDDKWYRAQVIGRSENLFNIFFIDYGNECDLGMERLTSLPQRLLDIPPHAFLCRLNGFDESKGFWKDEGYDEFFNVLVDKSLKVTVNSIGNHPKARVPQFNVEIVCEGVSVNTLMTKYWKDQQSSNVPTESLKSGVDFK